MDRGGTVGGGGTLDWAGLGLSRPRAIRLGAVARSRLAHTAELRDLTTPADAARAAAAYAGEHHFAADLLGTRPWLSATPARAVPAALLDTEGTGFLALLGEYGPWIYAGSVRDLQDLGGRYGALVGAASRAGEAEAHGAARRRPASLLTRLEVTDYRRPGRGGVSGLAELEAAFWNRAAEQAAARHREWIARR